MKVYLLLLLLLPALCSAEKFDILCHGKQFPMVDLMLHCTGKVQQACYTRDNGEKGCTPVHHCSNHGWTCCHTNECNA